MVRGASSLVCMKVGPIFRLWETADMELDTRTYEV